MTPFQNCLVGPIVAVALVSLHATSASATPTNNSAPEGVNGATVRTVEVRGDGSVAAIFDGVYACSASCDAAVVSSAAEDRDMLLSVLTAALLSGKKVDVKSEFYEGVCWIKRVMIKA
jgi:hypothetical protein